MITRVLGVCAVSCVLLLSSGCGDKEGRPPAPASQSPPASETATGSALPTPTVSMTNQATSFGPFVGRYVGHTRSLRIDRNGIGVEQVGDGCCHPLYDATYQLTDLTRKPWGWVAGFRILKVKVHDSKEVGPAARVGATGTLTLRRNGLITSSIDDQTFCTGEAARQSRCGA